MSEEYGPTIITLIGEDGSEIDLEHVDTIEYNGRIYMAFFPLIEAEDGKEPDEAEEDEYGLILLRVDEVNGEELLSVIEDEEEENAVYDAFMEELLDEDDE